jgi:hypothetical protein
MYSVASIDVLTWDNVIHTSTAIRILDPKRTPPISPNPAGTAFRVSTNDKKEYSETAAINIIPKMENSNPPL